MMPLGDGDEIANGPKGRREAVRQRLGETITIQGRAKWINNTTDRVAECKHISACR